MKYKYYHYLEQGGNIVIRIKAKRRPSAKTMPRSGSWVVRELIGGNWIMLCFPEIGLHQIEKLYFLGSVDASDN